MKAFMDTVFPRMARVRTTDQVLEMIRQAPAEEKPKTARNSIV
jgi:hypothetical protein